MTRFKSFLLLCGLLLGLLAGPAHAECGGQTQCIGVGATAAAAAAGHHGGTATFTLTYGNQALATPSASQTVFVAAVTGAGTATLGALTITGANAAEFQITGGTCPAGGGAGPVHGGANCTITVAFNPSSVGAKSATLNVPLAPPCGGCITGRTVSLAYPPDLKATDPAHKALLSATMGASAARVHVGHLETTGSLHLGTVELNKQ